MEVRAGLLMVDGCGCGGAALASGRNRNCCTGRHGAAERIPVPYMTGTRQRLSLPEPSFNHFFPHKQPLCTRRLCSPCTHKQAQMRFGNTRLPYTCTGTGALPIDVLGPRVGRACRTDWAAGHCSSKQQQYYTPNDHLSDRHGAGTVPRVSAGLRSFYHTVLNVWPLPKGELHQVALAALMLQRAHAL